MATPDYRVLILLLLILASALGVVYVKHINRMLFVEWQALKAERDTMDIEWGRLQLELSTWAAPSRVESIARTQLNMKIPKADSIRIVVQ